MYCRYSTWLRYVLYLKLNTRSVIWKHLGDSSSNPIKWFNFLNRIVPRHVPLLVILIVRYALVIVEIKKWNTADPEIMTSLLCSIWDGADRYRYFRSWYSSPQVNYVRVQFTGPAFELIQGFFFQCFHDFFHRIIRKFKCCKHTCPTCKPNFDLKIVKNIYTS